jgi:hypothetical protein
MCGPAKEEIPFRYGEVKHQVAERSRNSPYRGSIFIGKSTMQPKRQRIMAIAIWILILHIVSFGQVSPDAPLPDVAELWQRVRANLGGQYDTTQFLKGYTYRRSSVIEELGSGGSVEDREQREYDVYHFDQGMFQRLLSRNGMPLSEKDLKKEDERFEKFRTRKPRTRSRSDQEKVLNDIVNAFDFKILRREPRNDRSTLVLAFKPKKGAKLETMAARLVFTKVEGTAWVDEHDAQLARIDMHFIDDAKIGFGLLARISKNTQMTREWRKLNNEVWVPAHSESIVKGRVLLAKAYSRRRIDDYMAYKKFSLDE